MKCLFCKALERALETKRSQYIEARSAAFYQVSTKLAAFKNVNMQRAKSDLEEHQLVCASAGMGMARARDPRTISEPARF